jgi:hypothetical protein
MSRPLPGVPEAIFSPVQDKVESMITAVREAVETGTAAPRLFNFPSEGREMFMHFSCRVSGHADGVRAWRA